MNKRFTQAARHTLDGTIWNFLGDGLALPLGLLVSVFLTRRLGPEGYGLYALVTGTVLWVEWSIAGLFSRATVKVIGEAGNWQQVGAGIMRLYLLAGVSVALLFYLLANPLAAFMGEPAIAGYLRLFAVDIPLFTLAQAHKNMLVGTGGFRPRALSTAGRWISRFLLIVLLVELGFSIPGAILGNIGASLVELAIGRFYIKPALSPVSAFPHRLFWSCALPVFLSSISLGIFTKMDLFALKALGGTAAEAGFYGAAQNISLIPGVFALSFSPLLLANLSRMLHGGEVQAAKAMGRDAMRAAIVFLPFTAVIAGAAPEIIRLLFGAQYAAAAPLLSVLIVGAGAQAMIAITTVIIISMEKPALTFFLTGPLVPLALIGHLLMIPAMGAVGAALVTTAFSGAGAVATVLAVQRGWRIQLPLQTLVRSLLIFAAAYGAVFFWPAAGFLLLVKLPVIGLAVIVAFYLSGEFNAREIDLVLSLLPARAPDGKSGEGQ